MTWHSDQERQVLNDDEDYYAAFVATPGSPPVGLNWATSFTNALNRQSVGEK